jgi:F0F1-type ATP synthase assembly protein I
MFVNATKRKSTGTIRALQARESREQGAGSMDGVSAGTGYTVFSYLIAGMIAYGVIGWLVGKATHEAMLFPVGMLTGLAISIGFVIYRYGVQAARKESDR